MLRHCVFCLDKFVKFIRRVRRHDCLEMNAVAFETSEVLIHKQVDWLMIMFYVLCCIIMVFIMLIKVSFGVFQAKMNNRAIWAKISKKTGSFVNCSYFIVVLRSLVCQKKTLLKTFCRQEPALITRCSFY